MKRLTLAIGCAVCAWAIAFDGPLKVSANGRYLTFRSGEPFYYVADTPWQLLASLGIDDTREYIDIRATQGFTALQLVATPWSFDDTAAHWDFEGETGQARVNADGEPPFFASDGKPPKTNRTMPTLASAMYTANWVAATLVQQRFMNSAITVMKMTWPTM